MTDRRLPLEAGRSSFGADPALYDRARPPYPDELYALLEAQDLIAGRDILEVGAGTGAATLELARRGARRILALEPDSRLAAFLRGRSSPPGARIEVVDQTLEDARLPPGSFDLVAAATAFHWVDEATGLAAARVALRPGGGIALWWMNFGDPEQCDPFHEATQHLVSFGISSPSAGDRLDVPHAFDVAARTDALEVAGYQDIRYERIDRLLDFSPPQIRDLYATFSQNQQLPEREREALLDDLEEIATTRFGGVVQRRIVTTLYLARRP